MQKLREKRVPYLYRIDIHKDHNRKMARDVNVYRMRTIKIDDNGNMVNEEQTK